MKPLLAPRDWDSDNNCIIFHTNKSALHDRGEGFPSGDFT